VIITVMMRCATRPASPATAMVCTTGAAFTTPPRMDLAGPSCRHSPFVISAAAARFVFRACRTTPARGNDVLAAESAGVATSRGYVSRCCQRSAPGAAAAAPPRRGAQQPEPASASQLE